MIEYKSPAFYRSTFALCFAAVVVFGVYRFVLNSIQKPVRASTQAAKLIAAGDLAGARDSSDKAKKWAMWSAIAGVSLVVLYIIFIFAMGGMAALSQ